MVNTYFMIKNFVLPFPSTQKKKVFKIVINLFFN